MSAGFLGEEVQDLVGQIREEAGHDALAGVVQGLYRPEENPGLELFKELAIKGRDASAQQPSMDALTSLSLSNSTDVNDLFKKHIKAELDRRLAKTGADVQSDTAAPGTHP